MTDLKFSLDSQNIFKFKIPSLKKKKKKIQKPDPRKISNE